MQFARSVAHLVAHRRRTLIASFAALVIACVAIIAFALRFDSDVVSLLPRHFESVAGFKIYDREFAQGHALTFVLLDEEGGADLEAYAEHFGEMLHAEPWVERVMYRSPMETPGGIEDLQTLAIPLLLNLPPEDFGAAIANLEPQAINARLGRFRADLESGSPRAEMQLQFDPLGVVAPALAPLSSTFAPEQDEPLASPDGQLRIVLAVTNQADLGAKTSQELMEKVESLITRAAAEWDGGPAPRVMTTGRTPYVAEMSQGMHRDIMGTLLSSVLLVAVVFYIGFRGFKPLFALVHVLLICCVASIALCGLIFHELNLITVGLCAILVGLGVDFGMMIYGSYQVERNAGKDFRDGVEGAIRHHGPGVLFGALTTAAAFATLLRSDTIGFSQLGVLIAVGILLAGLFMVSLFFAFLGPRHVPPVQKQLVSTGLTAWIFQRPLAALILGLGILAAISAAALSPIGKLNFDANPRSLEPADSRAGAAIRAMSVRMPAAASEPIFAVARAENALDFRDRWHKLETHWATLVERGVIASFRGPGAFVPAPDRITTNAAKLTSMDLPASREALTATIEREGFSPEAFTGAFAVLDALQKVAAGDRTLLDWRKTLPSTSSWWFVVDRFFAENDFVAAAYISPPKTISSFEEKEHLRQQLQVPGIDLHLSGWTYMMADLVPWAKGKLVELSLLMVLVNVVLLGFLYRRVMPLVILLFVILLALVGLVATLKLFSIPLNLFNVLAFPLVLGVGVDYGIYILLGVRETGDPVTGVSRIMKPVLLSGVTTVCGFGSLGFAHNPSLSGLGIVCALGVAWCLFTAIFVLLPIYVWKGYR